MADFGTPDGNQAKDEHLQYVESVPDSEAVVTVQPTFDRPAHVETRRTIPFCTVDNPNYAGYTPGHHHSGIDVLQITDQILIQQTVELLDLIASVESENRYLIKVPRGDTIFEVAEKSSGWQRAIFGSARSYVLRLFDRSRREVIQIYRRAACSCCLFYCCCMQGINVMSVPPDLLGTVVQEWTMFVPTFIVKNHAGDSIYRIEGPNTFSVATESTFKILTFDGTREVGSITNQWNDLHLQHNLRVIFPFEENASMRAVLVGAAFLLQYMFFETSKKASMIRFNRFNTN